MKKITPSMVAKGGKRYCCVCKRMPDGFAQRVEAVWIHFGDSFCEQHKPKPTPNAEYKSEADYELERRYGI
jgi:hypothetical protein